jgi:hypothetical protein
VSRAGRWLNGLFVNWSPSPVLPHQLDLLRGRFLSSSEAYVEEIAPLVFAKKARFAV